MRMVQGAPLCEMTHDYIKQDCFNFFSLEGQNWNLMVDSGAKHLFYCIFKRCNGAQIPGSLGKGVYHSQIMKNNEK